MTKHRDFTVEPISYNGNIAGYQAVHDGYQCEQVDGYWVPSHPIFTEQTPGHCIEQIDDWYEENEE